MVNRPGLVKRRWAINAIFFFYGFTFASWASRIPSIQIKHNLTETALGTVLLFMPVGSFLTLPFSGYLVSKIGSKKVISIASAIYALDIMLIGNSSGRVILTIALFLFGSSGNMMNIAINTQAIALEEDYGKKIISSFHGMWSTAGLIAAAAGSWLTGISMPVEHHLFFVGLIVLIFFLISITYLPAGIGIHRKPGIFKRPGKTLLNLGCIAFCSMICQGAMFDWSGVYYEKVLHTNKTYIGLGYTAFMVSMAATRFISDFLVNRIGFKKLIFYAGIFTCSGLLIVVFNNNIIVDTLGMLLVGAGVSPVVPLVFSEAGRSTENSTGMAIATVSTIGFIGLMIGPPMIGFIAGASSLKFSFLVLSFAGLMVSVFTFFSKRNIKYQA